MPAQRDDQVGHKLDRITQLQYETKTQVSRLSDAQDRQATDLSKLRTDVKEEVGVTKSRVRQLEADLGDRPPDTPTAFAQLQSLQGFAARTKWIGSTIVGLIVTAFGAVLAWILGLFTR